MKKQGLNAYGDVFLGEYVDGKLNLTAYWWAGDLQLTAILSNRG